MALHLEQFVQFAYFQTCAGSNSFFAAGLENLGIGAFSFGHGLDQRDLPPEHFIIHTRFAGLLGHFAHARHHTHNAFDAAHFHHLFKLGFHIIHVELALLEPFHHALGLVSLDRF